VRLARSIDGRLPGGQPAAAPVAAAPVSSAPRASAHLLQASGQGDDDTQNFTVSTNAINVCFQQSGRSSTGLFGPSLFFTAEQPGGNIA